MTAQKTIREDAAKRHQHKYKNPNPIHQLMLGRFIDAVSKEIGDLGAPRTLDFGCGEGLFLGELKKRGTRFNDLIGVDIREEALAEAKAQCPEHQFVKANLLTWTPTEGPFDLVIASQVLEHLPTPERFMQRLAELSDQYLLLTVPWEPWFSIMNLMRGRDLIRLGNHPEHINHWGVGSFRRFIEPYADIVKLFTVFPFIIALANSIKP